MPVINYVEFNGTEHSVEVAEGVSLMQGAMDNLIDGMVAECGGCCVCCTCHCTSRLSCQVKVTAAMDGMLVRLPESQF
jgi:2Fe-2S ferredoxin